MNTTSETARKYPKANSENSKDSNVILPEEIIIDIISRLPVKQVFQLQCLSKNFSSITNDPGFINARLGHSGRLRPSIIFNKGNDMYLVQSNGTDSETVVVEVPLHRIIDLTDSTEKLKIETSCDGLVVFSVGDRDCFIWNPATVQRNRLPNPSYVDGMLLLSQEWGFGHCTKSSQYKIVRIAWYSDDSNSVSNEVAEVLSYGTDSEWRRLDFSKFGAPTSTGINVMGFVYWIVYDYGRLLSFDLEEEEFAWIVCPVPCFQIMEFQGSLAACAPSGINAYDIYVVKDAGNVDSWEIICNTGDIAPSSPIGFLNYHQLFMVDGHENDEFFQTDDDLIEHSCSLYDLEREGIKRIPRALATNRSVFLNCVESMVPLLP